MPKILIIMIFCVSFLTSCQLFFMPGAYDHFITPSWRTLCELGNGDGWNYCSLSFNNGIPYVVYQLGVSGFGNHGVLVYTNNTWQKLGGSESSGTSPSLAFNNGIPYAAFGSPRTTVMMCSNDIWTTLGINGFSAGEADYTSLAFNNGIPYVAYQDNGNSRGATIMYYSNGMWTNLGPAGIHGVSGLSGGVMYTRLVFNSGIPYLAFQNLYGISGGSNYLTVMYYSNGIWSNFGMAGFYTASENTSFVFNGNTPFIACQQINTGKANVMYYSNNAWQMLGEAGFSGNWVSYPCLAFNNGIPYVAYRDNYTHKATVMCYSNGAWQNFGSPDLSAGEEDYPSLAFNNGIPYIAFIDGTNYGSNLTVMFYK